MLNIIIIIVLYSETPKRKRTRKEKTCCPGSAEGTSNVPNVEALARKRRKKTVNQPRRKTQGQKKATEPAAPQLKRKRKRGEEECCLSAEEGTSKVPTNDAPAAKRRKRTNNNGPKSPKTAKRPRKNNGQKKAPKPDDFFSRYEIGEKLGEGGFGYVLEGRRISDGLQVAIKFVVKRPSDEYLRSPVESKVVPLEVALMQMMSQPPVCSNIVRLIEWFDQPEKYILVLERPDPCMELEQFLEAIGDDMDEERAKSIMVQAVEAACHCIRRGVLHRDIKGENFLLITDTSEIKLIDFGCGDLINTEGYQCFSGTLQYCPPEFFRQGKYHADPATVWSLGVLLFRIVCGHLLFDEVQDVITGLLDFRDGLSEGKINGKCCDLIEQCLQKNPSRRPSLQEVKEHVWLQCSVQA
ncbi:hypothetical protein NFI96_026814 [Prochilodus magdalenae]|nr:hypothetical protein NFI96_026814 [Prochilodus magdalenae]